MNDAPQPNPAGVVIVSLEPMQVAEIRGLLREAYMTGRPVFGEIRRTTTGTYVFAGLLDRATGRRVEALLAGPR